MFNWFKCHEIRQIFLVVLILMSLGVFFVFEASSVASFTNYHDSLFFAKAQLRWLAIGIVLMMVVAMVNYRHYQGVAFFVMLVVFLLLLAVLLPSLGSHVKGARRWLDIGFFRFQPTEFAKLGTILYLATWLLDRERRKFRHFLLFLGAILLLVLAQPDMGTAIVIFAISLTMYASTGKDLHLLLLFIPLALLGIVGLIMVAPYRLQRLTVFLNPQADPMGIGYHINQILISLSNGGLLGQGIGISRQKYLFLPEAHTDSIFAIIAEEVGFVGGTLIILAYLWLLYNIYRIYMRCNDNFARLLLVGIFAFFAFQSTINLAGMVALVPLTGVPLPFVSYGGSHILVSFVLLGIVFNIAKAAGGDEVKSQVKSTRRRVRRKTSV